MIEFFQQAMREAGLDPPEVITPGKLHRFPGIGKDNGNEAGRCKLFEDGRGGWFMDYSSGIEGKWQANDGRDWTAQEKADFKRQCERDRKAREQEALEAHEAAAAKAADILAKADGDTAQHPYAIKKGVPLGPLVKQGHWPQRGWNDALLIPLRDAGGKLWTLEAIDPSGEKDFLKGGRKRGCFHVIGNLGGADRVLIGEGLATVAAVHAATGLPVVAAMDAGNLEAVGRAVRSLAPTAEIVFLADNDIKPDGSNPGVKAATEACRKVNAIGSDPTIGCRVAVPELNGAKCDFWDVWNERGADGVKAALDPPNIAEAASGHDGSKKSQATLLIEMAGRLEAFHDKDMKAYVATNEGGRRVLPVRSQDFRRWLSREFFEKYGKGCNNNAVADALNTIEASAIHRGGEEAVFLRVANTGNRLYLDLCDEAGRVVEIGPDGWTIRHDATVNFIRKPGMMPFPEPERGGNVDQLRPFLNIHPEDFPLVIGWILGALRGKGPFPVMVLQGEQGTGKSTTSRVLRSFVDPSSVPLRNPPREVRDLLVSAINNWLPCLDNLSGLAPEFSDALCRLSTGGGMDSRALYSDTEQVLIDIQRPVLVNGIDDIAARPDLSERSIILTLPVIDPTQRRQESAFWNEFEAVKAGVFGAILDALAGAWRLAPFTHLSRLPRMGDIAVWATAAESALGWKPGTFMAAYDNNQQHAIEAGIEASPVGSTLLDLLAGCRQWTETPSELYATLTERAGLMAKSKAWPQSTKGLKNILHRLAPSLRRMGITYTQEENHARRYTFTQVPLEPPQPPQAPKKATKPSNGADSDGADGKLLSAPNRPFGADRGVDVHIRGGSGQIEESYPPIDKPSNGAGLEGSGAVRGGSGGYSGPSVNECEVTI